MWMCRSSSAARPSRSKPGILGFARQEKVAHSGVDTFNKNQPSGLYFWASSSSQLQSAFAQIANYILRISN